MRDAEALIRQNLRTQSRTLNLENCGLTGKEPCLQLLKECTQHGLTALDLSYNQISDISFLKELYGLKDLDLRFNQISDIAPLEELIFYFSINKLFNTISWQKLPDLTFLYLSNNQVSDIAPLKILHSLTTLDLSNNQILDISPLADLPALERLYLSENPVKGIPKEVLGNDWGVGCLDKIKPYLAGMKDTDYVFEGKLILVGEPAAGKTTLCRKLLDSGFKLQKAETEMTRGIAVTPWRFPYQNPKNTPVHEGFDGQFTAHIFDFGGQDILHATHRYFFSRRTVYVLVVDTRPEDTDFYYWLNIIELFGEQSPVVIVLNNKHGIYKEVPTVILEQFKHLIKGVFHVNLANNEGLESLTTQVQTLLQSLPHVGEERHPKVWNEVRQELGKFWLPDSLLQKWNPLAKKHEKKPYLRIDEFVELCESCDLQSHKKSIGIAQTLHVLGSLLYFHENPFLEDFIILDKHWATEAVYLVLQDEAVAKNHGKFTSKDLERLWRGKYKPDTYAPLAELMLNFKIAYRTREHNTYIAPQLLKENPPENYAEVMQASASFRFEYRYTKFMPKGLLSRLIVEKNRQIHEGLQWRTGVVLKIRNALVEAVEHRYGSTNKLAFRAVGENAHVAMEAIFELFEEIHGEFPNLKFEEMIPCHCADCEASPAPNFFPYQRLQEAQKMGKITVECQQVSWKDVSLQRLLQGYEKLASDKAERWIDRGNFSEFFAEFEGKMEDMDKPLFEKLRYQFINGDYGYDFYERARVLRRKYI